ncbi:hypothetical protein [Amycolatopsis vastitatis]|uniref:Uncharacterized protein n=1 Tax=Amycolatopsis vastitatis TaxID=1905142 RepID=A0A229SWB4_9PSEU|nr:hypothetical protein [Amycolatopsis vastitatis]OXM63122.1 hypothetical protein CF165_32715 [Amycolatopsis vastitatis]
MTIPFGTLVVLAREMISQASAPSASGGETAQTVAALLTAEPRNEAGVLAVVTVIFRDALADPFRETTANRWRPLLPAWVHPPLVGAAVNRLRATGILVATGRYVHSTDSAGRNVGKLQPVYTLDVEALREHSAARPAAAS